MKSRGRVEQIEEKENEIRRYSLKYMSQNTAAGVGTKLLKSRGRNFDNQKLKQAEHSWQSKKEKDTTVPKRPASVALPYITPKLPASSTKDRSSQRAKSLFPQGEASDGILRINEFSYGNAKSADSTSQVNRKTKEFQDFPVDKEGRAHVEHNHTSVDLNPVSYTYLLMLEENPPESMTLRNHGLGTKSLSVMRNTLENNNNVKELDLEGNLLDNVGVEDLGIMLRGNMCIERLNISSNTFSSKGIIALGHLLESNKTLRVLSLSRNKLTDTDLELLCSSLEDTDNNIKTLDLSFNSFTLEAGQTLGRFLSDSSKLEDLSIAGNNFGASGIRHIFEGLKLNSTLQKLDAACNEISDRGIEMIADLHALGRNLKCLDLSDNFITKRGIKIFMPILDGNDSLNTLKLDNNQIGTNGLIFVLESLIEQVNDSLRQLHARGVFADQTIMTLCDDIRTFNKNFVLFGVTGNMSHETNNALDILQIYLSRNKIIDCERSDRIDVLSEVDS